MTYSEQEIDEIERDPARLRAYFWNVAMRSRRRAAVRRADVTRRAVHSSPVAFDECADAGREELRRARIEENLATAILDNLDALVASTLAIGERTIGENPSRTPVRTSNADEQESLAAQRFTE